MKMHNVSFFLLAPILYDKVELFRQNAFIAPFKNTAGVFWHSLLAALFQTFHIPDSKKNLF